MEVTIERACSIVSMRELLDDPLWGPEEFCWMIYQEKGLLSEKTKLLEQYAPVKVWHTFSMSGDYDGTEIVAEGDKVSLSAEDKIIICYVTGAKTSHMECIKVKGMPLYADKKIYGIVIRVATKSP